METAAWQFKIKRFISLGAVLAFLGVALGAFAAHGLKDKIDAKYLEIFQIGVRYQIYHSLAIILAALTAKIYGNMPLLRPVYFFSFGILFFSGSLYALALSGVSRLGAITPIGGLLFLAGWVVFALNILKNGASHEEIGG